MKHSELSTPKQERSKDFLQRKLDHINQMIREADAALGRVQSHCLKSGILFYLLWICTQNLWFAGAMAVSVMIPAPFIFFYCRHDGLLRKAQQDVRERIASMAFQERLRQ